MHARDDGCKKSVARPKCAFVPTNDKKMPLIPYIPVLLLDRQGTLVL